ncbi:sialate O-acetylesterase [Arsenicibacter rosenii]|uniref:Sialate O-acetylesterase n=2 Tax=Arsenicibacter rosenii TaxID=1750698 RepID=A0A1S2VCN8_9BACT|nr:sialate O-acetylesterase [Arsenicibacter rosenii]
MRAMVWFLAVIGLGIGPVVGLAQQRLAQQRLAALRLADVWQSGMVVQRGQPVTVWGWGIPGKRIKVTFGRSVTQTRVAPDASWQVRFPARKAAAIPVELRVESGTDQQILTDILVGDVWLCAGQSNMAFPMTGDPSATRTLSGAGYPLLRLWNRIPGAFKYNQSFTTGEVAHLHPEQYFTHTPWQTADSITARPFSAVGFYTGLVLQQALHIPIGLIHVAVGGSPAEAWLPPATTGPQAPFFTGDWWANPVLEPWCIQRGHENLDALIKAGIPVPRDAGGYQHPYKPGFLYTAAIAPLNRLAIKGILWYQGESNALSLARVQQHETLFPAMISQWRQHRHQPGMPVYICQLSSISTEKGYQSTYWPLFRDSQRRMATHIPNMGMAVTSDLGHPTDVHPVNKKTVGERLAREILVKTYGQKRLPAPQPQRVVRTATGWRLTLTHTGTGLHTADGQAIRGFATGDATGPQTNVTALFTGSAVLLSDTAAATGRYLYYGWQPFTTANVVNSEGLPLTTFRMPLP